MRRRTVGLGLLVLLAVLLAGCAPGANEAVGTADPGGGVAGFWLGLWHGLIVIVTLVVSLFTDSVSIYDVHNTGAGYDIGFFIGLLFSVGGLGGGSAKGARRRSRA